MDPALSFIEVIEVGGRRLEYRYRPGAHGGRPTLVFLHEGLGSVSLWKQFPDRVADALGCGALVYSRYGYGGSEVLEEAHRVDYMHREGLEVLPALLQALEVSAPVLIGHSDGASIALVYAGSGPDSGARRGVRSGPDPVGLVLLAPHVFVERLSVDSIAAAKVAFETTDLPQRLARHHADPARTFYGWNDIWLHPEFRSWNIEEYLPGVRCPVLVIQGRDDEYGTMRQVEAIRAQCEGSVEVVALDRCGHSPQRDRPEASIAAIVGFVSRTVTAGLSA
ncbi:alpha/beta fold hydrolase [Haliangium sp.]|uniref:alpha/beta fold hydrolase n=1 Tax=Haliangium sp. TaxID=2663208 RepID=UPI003D0A1100